MTSRRIEDLQPLLQAKARYWLQMCEQEWPGKEVDPLITNTLRTMAEQAALYEQGRNKPGKIVTWAKPGSSAHNYGLAFDFVPLRLGKPVWTTKTTEDRHLWTRMGQIAETLGLEWGGRWTKVDMPHIQVKDWRSFVQ